jgi:hypothetical protein
MRWKFQSSAWTSDQWSPAGNKTGYIVLKLCPFKKSHSVVLSERILCVTATSEHYRLVNKTESVQCEYLTGLLYRMHQKHLTKLLDTHSYAVAKALLNNRRVNVFTALMGNVVKLVWLTYFPSIGLLRNDTSSKMPNTRPYSLADAPLRSACNRVTRLGEVRDRNRDGIQLLTR